MQRLRQPLSTRGFTLLETMVALAMMGIVLAAGVPRMSAWIFAGKAASASQFYAEGLALARGQALTHNSASRLVLVANPGKLLDWRVDICFPRPDAPCNEISANWSTVTTPASGDGEGTAGFLSVLRRSDALPPPAQLTQVVAPDEARAVYFTPMGWVNPAIAPRIERIDLTPAGPQADAAPASAIVLTLAGIATRCKPGAPATDPQRCPP